MRVLRIFAWGTAFAVLTLTGCGRGANTDNLSTSSVDAPEKAAAAEEKTEAMRVRDRAAEAAAVGDIEVEDRS